MQENTLPSVAAPKAKPPELLSIIQMSVKGILKYKQGSNIASGRHHVVSGLCGASYAFYRQSYESPAFSPPPSPTKAKPVSGIIEGHVVSKIGGRTHISNETTPAAGAGSGCAAGAAEIRQAKY